MRILTFLTGAASMAWAFLFGRQLGRSIRQNPQGLFASNTASNPTELTKTDWKRALNETKQAIQNKNLSILAAGVAFFATLSFFPLLAAGVAIAAIAIDPSEVQSIAAAITSYMPADVAGLINGQLSKLVNENSTNVLVAAIAILISLYSASAATQNLITATNYAYDLEETRGFIKLKLLSLGLTLGAILFGFIAILLLAVSPGLLVSFGVPAWLADVFGYGRWLLLLVLISFALAAFYRYGPDRPDPKWQWVSWGATAATVIWLIGTALFFLYVQNFGNYSNSYGVFAGIIILMIWLNLSAFIFLLAAEVNHKIENQTDAATETS